MNFNGAQIHLLTNHLPVVGFVLLTPVLALAAWRGDSRLRALALCGAVAISLLTIPAFVTGEPAEESVEHLAGISEHLIHEHEEAAEKALVMGLLTGGVALVGYFLSRKNDQLLKTAVYATLAGSILTSLAMAKTAHEGGKIRHPEIRGDLSEQSGNGATATSQHDRDGDEKGERDDD